MYIIAIGWIYVVSMLAITEPSITAGIMTFTSYCAIPLGIIWFIMTGIKRRIITPNNQQTPPINFQNTAEEQ